MLIKLILTTFFLIFVVILSSEASEDAPEVKIKQGTLKGKYQNSRQGRAFSAFTAIPYAKPPVGERRFKVAEPAGSWKGVLDATKPHAACPQTNSFQKNSTVIGDEDCLYLNVYTPQLPDSEKNLLPVIFYIHGGGWVMGSANFYGPDLLLDKDVVLVTANYRLGPLGFLTTGDMHVLGNNGLKDQSLAIKWTKDNIASFGGDPEGITLLGHSAGAASVHYHMLSPLSKKLINGVIAQSGTALAHWALMPHFLSTRRSKILAGNLGCPTYYTNEMLDCLIKVDANDIIKQTEFFVEWDLDPLIPFKPVIEPNIPGAFLPADPIDIITEGKAANIPFMTGLTSDEGASRAASLFGNPDLVKEFDKDFNKLAPTVLMYGETAARKYIDTVTSEIRKFYFGDKAIDESTKTQFSTMYGDALFLAAEDVAVELHAKFNKQPIYYYLFGYKGSTSFTSFFDNDDYGVCHGDELNYLLNSEVYFPGYKPTESDNKVTELMTTLWANFAKHGNPTPETDSAIRVKWETLQKGKQNYYHIKSDDDVEVGEGLYEERAKFWRSLEMNVRTVKIRDEL